jgi:hypothetical protein
MASAQVPTTAVTQLLLMFFSLSIIYTPWNNGALLSLLVFSMISFTRPSASVTHPFSGLHRIIYKLLAGSIIKSPAQK